MVEINYPWRNFKTHIGVVQHVFPITSNGNCLWLTLVFSNSLQRGALKLCIMIIEKKNPESTTGCTHFKHTVYEIVLNIWKSLYKLYKHDFSMLYVFFFISSDNQKQQQLANRYMDIESMLLRKYTNNELYVQHVYR